jgi:hypothetical protein
VSKDSSAMDAFNEKFSTDQQCAEALFHARWPDGFRCPICRHPEYYLTRTRRHPLFECKSCRHQTSLIAGTIMGGSSTSLSKWFKAFYLMSLPGGISAVRLSEAIEVTYKTAWLMAHKIREAMRTAEQSVKLEGVVQVSTFGYGYALFFDAHQPVLLGGSFNEQGELQQIKLQQPDPDHVRLPARTVDKEGYRAFLAEHVNSSEVTSLPYYAKVHPQLGPFRLTVKNWLNSTFGGIGAKHLHAYLNEYSFRINAEMYDVEGTSFRSLLSWCATTAKITYRYLIRPRRILPIVWKQFETKAKWIARHREAWSY